MKHNLLYLIAAAFAFVGCVKVPEPAQPIPGAKADFTYTENTPFNVTFKNNSNSTRLEPWLWEYGDGASSGGTAQQVTHKYGKAGTYTVTLTCKDANSISYTCTKTITVVGDGGTLPPDPQPETGKAYVKGFRIDGIHLKNTYHRIELYSTDLWGHYELLAKTDYSTVKITNDYLPYYMPLSTPALIGEEPDPFDWYESFQITVYAAAKTTAPGAPCLDVTIQAANLANKTEYTVKSPDNNTTVAIIFEYK